MVRRRRPGGADLGPMWDEELDTKVGAMGTVSTVGASGEAVSSEISPPRRSTATRLATPVSLRFHSPLRPLEFKKAVLCIDRGESFDDETCDTGVVFCPVHEDGEKDDDTADEERRTDAPTRDLETRREENTMIENWSTSL